jgi:acyl-CoA hydrolase
MTAVREEIAAKQQPPEAVLSHLPAEGDAIVGLGNGEPKTVVDAIEAGAAHLKHLRLHQMLPLRDRPYIEGEVEGMRHVSWFLSRHNKEAFQRGDCDLVPNNFSEVPILLRQTVRNPIVLAAVSPPDEHGYFSLGLHAEYVAPMVGEMPFFVEVNAQMPRTFGENQIHISQVLGWCEADYPLVEVPPREPQEADLKIAALVAERIPNGATVQAGIGAVPDQVLALLAEHRELGIHTELLSEGVVDLVEKGVVTGTCKRTHRNKIITTTALGTKRLFDFVADNPGVEFWPVDETNNPRKIAEEPHFTSINATIEVDFLGQCASESLGSAYWSSSGGQPDFARGAVLSENGQAFIVLHSTTSDGETSRIVPRLHPGAAVTTFKNVVDRIVTEYGVAELRGSTIAERTQRLINIADPKFRDELTQEAHVCGYLSQH